MAIRPPRQARPRRRPARQRDLIITIIASTLITTFGLRFLAALIGVAAWTSAWRVVDMPTRLIVQSLAQIPYFDSEIVGRLTVADTAAVILVGALTLLALASLSLRRAG